MSRAPEARQTPAGGYTEADIVRLEDRDLTDLSVLGELKEAYRQNDPNEEEFFPGFRREPTHTLIGTEDSFKRRIAEAKAELRASPTDYTARTKRLYAMAGLEIMRRREELRARHPEVYYSGLCRMNNADESLDQEKTRQRSTGSRGIER